MIAAAVGAAAVVAVAAPVVALRAKRLAPVTLAQLRQLAPRLGEARARQLLPGLHRAMSEADLRTVRRRAAFLAQVLVESDGLTAREEYASGEAYEGRENLGNTQPGDGRRFKGRGWIQLTGRANYREAGKALGLALEARPELAATDTGGWRVAAWYWRSRSLNQWADSGTLEDFRRVTYRINGGQNGATKREAEWRRALSILGGTS